MELGVSELGIKVYKVVCSFQIPHNLYGLHCVIVDTDADLYDKNNDNLISMFYESGNKNYVWNDKYHSAYTIHGSETIDYVKNKLDNLIVDDNRNVSFGNSNNNNYSVKVSSNDSFFSSGGEIQTHDSGGIVMIQKHSSIKKGGGGLMRGECYDCLPLSNSYIESFAYFFIKQTMSLRHL